jgi:hypothetical protein
VVFVCGDIDTGGDAVNDRGVTWILRWRRIRDRIFDETRETMNIVVAQGLWKWKLVAGTGESDLPGHGWCIVSVLADLTVIVWPFQSAAMFTLAAGIWLVIFGSAQIRASIPNPQCCQHRGATPRRISLASGAR